MASLREEGADADRIRWGEANLRKAKAKVAEKEEAIEGFDGAVRRSERELAAVVARVKDEEVHEVVELDAEMEEGILNEEEEAKVVEAAPVGGGGGKPLAQGVDGVEGCGGHPRPAMGPGSASWPPPPKSGHPPPCRPGESGIASLVFVGRGCGNGWTRGGLCTWTSPCAWGRSTVRGGGNVSCRGRGSDGGRWGTPPKWG